MVHVLSNIGTKFDVFFIYFLWQHFGSFRVCSVASSAWSRKDKHGCVYHWACCRIDVSPFLETIEAMSQSFPQHVVHGDLHRMVTSVVVHMSKCVSHRNHHMAMRRVARIFFGFLSGEHASCRFPKVVNGTSRLWRWRSLSLFGKIDCGVNRFVLQVGEVEHAHLPLWRSSLRFIPLHDVEVS